MTDYEKLGAFYLGKRYDLDAHARTDDLVLYDAKDLTTHAVIIGMTGSGKTGLGIDLLEEAIIDHIPVIAIDPKGDLGNLALRFPRLDAADFRPWIDPQQASAAGLSEEEFASKQATTWREGLESWQQDGARIGRLVDSADVTIYTPGSSAGRQISLLRAFAAPPVAVREDAEAFREQLDATATGLLSLLGIDADPISSREHILLANLLSNAWLEGRDLDLPSIIAGIQAPPFTQLGVMPLDTIFPPKDRLGLAMQLNNLLAAPGFQNWMQGDALDAARLFYDASGKPRASVVSIAHLGDAERMFFVTLLLADIIAWMRTQPGTGSLRAILYIDELFGYMPPVANPPSKTLLLTLLKQARAFGIGVVLASQNPVDLDYRGLSNAGTWFIGRLQTERDKMRVMEGLEGASGAQAFDKAATERTIAGLGKRVFMLHSVHESAPIIFETRWTLSYLAGPMTREQIRRLNQAATQQSPTAQTSVAGVKPVAGKAQVESPVSTAMRASGGGGLATVDASAASHQPVLPADIAQYFLPARVDGALVYHPTVVGIADVAFASARYSVAEQRRVVLLATPDDGPISLNWDDAERVDTIDPDQFERDPGSGASFAEVPRAASTAKNYASWSKALQKWVVTNEQVAILSSARLKLASRSGESESDFRIRLQVAAREERDDRVEKLRAKYATRITTLQERLRRADQSVQRETAQARQAGVDSMISMGGAILGAVFGRGKIGVGTIGKVGTAARGVGRAAQQRGDVTRASETVEALTAQYSEVQAQLEAEIAELGSSYDAQTDTLDTIIVKAKSGDVRVQLVALLWVPYVRDSHGMTTAAWR